jgi:hypothetical protein
MNFIRKVANSDILASIIDIPEALRHKKVEILIFPIEENEEHEPIKRKNKKARGSLKKYSNAELIAQEDGIWERVMVEKNENR